MAEDNNPIDENNLLDLVLSNSKDADEPAIAKENQYLEPLLDELNYIDSVSVEQFVRALLLKATAFWLIPSSFSEDAPNPMDELSVGGNVLHTKRVVRAALVVANAFAFSGNEKDILIAAALLHDVTKAIVVGLNEEPVYDSMHPYTVDSFVRNVYLVDGVFGSDDQSTTLYIAPKDRERILRLVRTHKGHDSMVVETQPKKRLEYALVIANDIAKHLPFIVDGNDIMEWRWPQVQE